MARKRIEVEAASGNVFADLGYPDARERSLKVELAMEVNRILGERGLAQRRIMVRRTLPTRAKSGSEPDCREQA